VKSKLRLPLVVAAAVLGTVACSDTAQPGHSFELVEENGIPVAVNSAVPQFSGELFTYEKAVEIVPDPDVEESFLYDPNSFTVDEDGVVYVAEQRNFRVSVWDREGNYLRSIGQRGEGPGEFPFGPVANLDVRDGILSVPILQQGRTMRFRTDGTYIDTLAYPSGPRAMSIHEGPNGELVVISQPSEQDFRRFGAGVTVVGADDQVLASFETAMVDSGHYAASPRAIFVPPDEVVTSSGAEPVLRWYGLDGVVRREVRLELSVEPVTGEDRQGLEDYIDRMIANAPESRDEPGGESGTKDYWRRQRETLEFPETKAFWSSFLVSDVGWLWLIKSGPEIMDYRANSVWEVRVLDPEGRYVGDTATPPIFYPMALKRDLLLALVNDRESGERVPTIFRVRSARDGFEYAASK